MTVLRFQDQNGSDLGLISWFAVHGTAMNNTNLLISSDNKGYAAYEVELQKNPTSLPGMGPFVAAFAQRFFFSISFLIVISQRSKQKKTIYQTRMKYLFKFNKQ